MNPFKKKYTVTKYDELEKLWEKACSFGKVGVFMNDSFKHSVSICFPNPVVGSELKVQTKFNVHDTLRSALIDAIEMAEELKSKFK